MRVMDRPGADVGSVWGLSVSRVGEPPRRSVRVRSFNGVGVRDKIASVLVNPFVFAELRSANGSSANATFEVRSMRVGVRTWRHLCACTHALPRGSAAPEIRRGDSRG
jgi:hypothetical protein